MTKPKRRKKPKVKDQRTIAKEAKKFRNEGIRQSYLSILYEPLTVKVERVAKEFGIVRETVRLSKLRALSEGDDWDRKLQELRDKELHDKHEEKVLAKYQIKDEVGFKDMVVEVKAFAFLMLSTSHKLAITAVTMIDYYSGEIQRILKEAGGTLEKCNAYQKDEIKGFGKELNYYKKDIEDFLKPAAVTGYLKLIGIEEAAKADLDDIDKEAFTIDKLQSKLNELGMKTLIEGDKDFIASKFVNYLDKMPNIEGTR